MNQPVVIDGGTGAELQRRGVPMDEICWFARAALTHHAELVGVHVAYIEAGAKIITANTFATHRYVMSAAGHEDETAQATTASVAAARRAKSETGAAVEIAGSMSCMPPGIFAANYPANQIARSAYLEHALLLAELDVAIIALEMIQDLDHGCWALDAALTTNLPVWLGFSCRIHPQSGEIVCFDRPEIHLEALLAGLIDRKPQLINIMHTPLSAIPAAIECVRRHWDGPLGVYPEIGSYDAKYFRRTGHSTPAEFSAAAAEWIELGASVVGGCCGATPKHISALTQTLSTDANC